MERSLRAVTTCGLVVVLGVLLFAGGFIAGRGLSLPDTPLSSLIGSSESSAAGDTPQALQTTFAPFWESWDLVHREFVDQPVDDNLLMQGAIRGMLDALGDEHSGYMNPTEYEIATTSQTGELEGIGANVEPADDHVRIVAPLPGSPAAQAGILPGDLIIKVDDTDITGMDYFVVISMVRGPAGSTVHLTIQREGHDEPLEFDVVRARIVIPSVESRMLTDGVAYVKINDFGQRTTTELRDQLQALLDQEPAGLVVDLRGNPGGLLNTAIEVVSQFIAEGVVMREKYGDGREDVFEAHSGGLATDIPLVVLIDQGSASASEIVAGAIQDRQRGTLVGETSFGKGSVQNWHDLQGDNGAVRVTIARWYTPDGRSIHELGIAPDVPVEITEEDRAAGRDPQLNKAIELLTSGAGTPARLYVWNWPMAKAEVS